MIKLDNFFSNKYDSWAALELAINALPTAQEKGEVFEQFVYLYLHLHTDYYQIKELYRAKDIPEKYRKQLALENTDYGVDGIWILRDGTCSAYQAKFRESRQSATVRELATFWSEAEKADNKYVIANAVDLPRPADKHGYSILVDTFEKLEVDFFNDIFQLYQGQAPVKKAQYKPLAHQQRMITNTLRGFEKNDRGKLIAACGAGKTLISLWITEASGLKKVIFLAPSLALIKQTLEAWSRHANHKFAYICVCSDQSVVSEVEADYGDYDISEVDFPVTTDPGKIRKFLDSDAEYKYIFTTYNSTSAVADALKGTDYGFQLGIFDEAHRTAGQKDTEMFSVAIHDKGIPIEKRLFMTATERLVSPRIKKRAKEVKRTIFSMDDTEVYGPLFDRYSFGEAIKDKVISDYKIILTAIDKEEVMTMVRNNQLLVAGSESTAGLVTAENIFKQIVLAKAMREFDLQKAVSFHSSVKRARAFVSGNETETFDLEDLMVRLWPELEGSKKYFATVDGQMPAGLRKQKLKEFEDSDFAVISNAKCLTEGVDVPIIDSIYFVDPKTSLVDIVQACGRALRKGKREGSVAHFIVPVLLHPSDSDPSLIEDERFETLLNLVQALRDQDERLADIIDKINMQIIKGGSTGTGGGELPITFSIPTQFNLAAFSHEVQLRILEANGNPTEIEPQILEDTRLRRSSFKASLKPVGDYAYQTMFEALVAPTLEKFVDDKPLKEVRSLELNHNSISHTERLRLIRKTEEGYVLTDLGKRFKDQQVDSKEIMRLVMLTYRSGENMYPYRAVLEVLLSVGKFNYIEFLYGIYTLPDSSPESISDSIAIINEIRTEYPNILASNINNRNEITDALNAKYGTTFKLAELWGSTTPKNKFLYFREHLSLFEGVDFQNKEIVLREDAKSEIIDMLESSRDQ
ncbi:MAG: DEAD/DEAH box helicase family protein [Candidatus Obscuribacterales bacterium]|nr:DEAD/DEAH box helicase family protein [Candidatus Obscuribacterales bacterium]